MMLLSLTRLRLHSWLHLRRFFKLAGASVDQAVQDPECLAGATYVGPGLTFWTATVWRSEVAMQLYVRTGAHKETLPWLARLCSEGATSHVLWNDSGLPEKKQVLTLLTAAPKFFRVQFSSLFHSQNKISARRPWLMVRFK